MQLLKMNLLDPVSATNQSLSGVGARRPFLSDSLFILKRVVYILTYGIFGNTFADPFQPGKEKRPHCTLTTPRKTFCVAAMRSSLCSATVGWMLSFWAARSTCCPDTVTDSNRDDISICKTSSSVSRIRLQVKSQVFV